jgi:phosphoribosylanthranilate isomerase
MDIKICGLRTEDALAAALAGGASHVGFIFFAKSPRNIEPAEAGRLRRFATGRAKAVAVTVDAEDATLDRIVKAMAPDVLQLHGSESPARIVELKARYGLPVMKALSVPASPTASSSTPSRRRAPNSPAATACRSTGCCFPGSIRRSPTCFRAG